MLEVITVSMRSSMIVKARLSTNRKGKKNTAASREKSPRTRISWTGRARIGFLGIQNLIGEHDGNETLQYKDLGAIAVHPHVSSKDYRLLIVAVRHQVCNPLL